MSADTHVPIDPEGEIAAEQARIGAEVREIDALIGSTRTEVVRLQTREESASASLRAVRARADASGAEAFAASDELVLVLRRKGAIDAELETLQAKRKLLDRLAAQLLRPSGGAAAGAAAPRVQPIDDVVALFRAVVDAQEQERRRIARVVHDGPAQSMANIVLQAEMSERVFAIDVERARAELSTLRAMVNRTLQELRAIIFELRPMILDDLGLVPTLRRYLQTLVAQSGVPVDFSCVGPDRRLPEGDEVAVFRLIQDALHERVAQGAKSLAVAMDWRDDQVEVRIQSDGTAAPRGELSEDLARNERVGLLGAEATVESRADGRTVVVFRVPIVPTSRMII